MSPQRPDVFDDFISLHSWKPPVDACETTTSYVLRAEVPEVERQDLSLRIQSNTLEISGERSFDNVGVDQYDLLESFHGKFRRTFSFPTEIDSSQVTAELQSGVLTVRILKRRPQRRRIDIEGQ